MFFIIELLVSLLFLIFILFLLIYLFIDLISLLQGAPYVLSDPKRVKKIIKFANIKPGEKAADLGSGDGRIVIALAKAGAEVHGYEINPFLVWLSRRNIRKARLTDKAFIHWKSFWQEDFSNFNVVTVYGFGHIMERLELKLKKELKIHSRVVSNAFVFPTWSQSKEENKVYLYEKTV